MAFDQDAVDEAVRVLRAELQPQIDELKARLIAVETGMPTVVADQQSITFPGGRVVVYDKTSDTG